MSNKIFTSLWGARLGPLPASPPDGLPDAAKQVVSDLRARDEAAAAAKTPDERMMDRLRDEHYALPVYAPVRRK